MVAVFDPGRIFFFCLQFCARGLSRPHLYQEWNIQPLWKVKGFEQYTSWKARVPDRVFREKRAKNVTPTCTYTHTHTHTDTNTCACTCVFVFFFFCCLVLCHVVFRAWLVGWVVGWVWCGVVWSGRHVVVVVVLPASYDEYIATGKSEAFND